VKIKRGVLVLADLSPRSGTEAGKLRPVLVMQTNFLNDIGHPSTWILPCTTQCTGESLLRVLLPKNIAGNKETCEIMIDQSRSIDNRRFNRQLKEIPLTVLNEIKEKLILLGELK
jgi:mRNA interferase MazF